ncbi:non-canonical purine NTP pyrophosphatase, RdgB/HAM1 family [Nautilia profundicola AmH]|uniref:dITP/XTP pyrophosphatase n=1 Tax=Nautilia profundicola (strain ATCC BAA-1463 / DSM 18972 / AmH) TaxID=598659 RepID=IXTPA_NAUPA|nr:RdgB/HAM1 family non-canonical purine NTP pyrophosphatase [Nautilia profundicola]B9L638.1 RecName: Full=dITP/XTP pyrophosphatase; AltName: Full=Non-canonical purine NTP pyrophosphatase; AltName: Full=Non-standard purine NTP pyrophosphatase; AltName: Full=Nucleoside-triphosphate diphosphatase; AltName: Full=Nucleoside-triphosphate pyrophosphatase; Short=NTPase [Nautilia profundicola AmH]ACM92782.1 non-canonical purine NTP pyrophosphatase, RdgB/HAM1 family [Nautilia profundicola AmH]
MKIIVASSNKGKIKEIKKFFEGIEILPYSELIEPFEIEENGTTFKDNAIIKAKTIYEKLPGSIVLADDSGISVPVLGGVPGIYSARFAGAGASDKDNLYKLIDELKKRNIKKTYAYYTAAIALATPYGIFTTHGFMHGNVIDEARGNKGFGYDPMFIPKGFDKTLGELDENIKKSISHRSKALELANILLKSINN